VAGPRIALIHATPVAVEPVREAFSALWPEAEAFNLLDDSLSADRAKSGPLSRELSDRIIDLGRYARKVGADGILYTCSAFGEAIEETARQLDVPVLKPNEAMFEAALEAGKDCAMIATFGPAVESMESEFAEEAARRDPSATIKTCLVEPAMTALRAGDAATHNRLVAEAVATLPPSDAIVLAHFSTSRAAEAVRAVTTIPVLTSPDAAVAKMKRLLTGE
jgi:aspartate/glutamate racemase